MSDLRLRRKIKNGNRPELSGVEDLLAAKADVNDSFVILIVIDYKYLLLKQQGICACTPENT